MYLDHFQERRRITIFKHKGERERRKGKRKIMSEREEGLTKSEITTIKPTNEDLLLRKRDDGRVPERGVVHAGESRQGRLDTVD
jgi:hypothetical protein